MRKIALFFLMIAAMTVTSCDNRVTPPTDNPLTGEWSVPPFDLIESSHYEPAIEYAMAVHTAEIEAIAADRDEPSFGNVIAAYDRSGELLSRVTNTFSMVASADKDDVLSEAEERLMPKLAAHFDEILLNEKLFKKIAALYDKRGALGLEPRQMRLLEKTYDRFVRAGALLNADDKRRLKEINAELSMISVKYGNNILAATNDYVLELDRDQLDGLPIGVRDAAAETAAAMGREGKWVFTLHKPSWIPFLTYSTKRELREQIYKAYLNRCDGGEFDNRPLINDFIRLRIEKANLLGYKSYADYVVGNEMAGDKKAVYELLESVWTPALERASEELAQMQPMFERDHPGETFGSWDWWFYAEKVRKRDYSLDEEMLRPYFSLSGTLSGIFFLANRLYGITFRPVSSPVYNDECRVFAVSDSDDSPLGTLLFDLHPRSGKGAGAWCGYFVEPTYNDDGTRNNPFVGIVCNFPRSVGETPSLLTTDDVETLFHEFGHALHFLFTNAGYRGLLDVEGDFVELPSQIMENWAFESELLDNYATNYRTGDIIPRHLVERLHRSGQFNQGFATTELVAAALSDMDIHSLEKYEGEIDVDAFEREALNGRRGLIGQIEPRYHYPYFSHIFDGGYSAGYYFYIWAEVLDKDAYEAFRETGDLFDRRTAEKFRREILEKGGSDEGMKMYRAFRGADPDRLPLLKARGLWKEPAVEESTEK